MVDPSRTVFLSYRRDVSWALAHAVRGELVQHGFDVFMDVHGIGSGEFERVLLREIETRAHVVVILEPRSLDRIVDDGDWLRREIAHALTHGRNVVPVLANRAEMPPAADLPLDVARLAGFNAVSVPPDYFAEAMDKLRRRFLRPVGPAPTGRRRRDRTGEPGPPSLELSEHHSLISLTWTEVPEAVRYELERTDPPGFSRSVSMAGRATTHQLLWAEVAARSRIRVRGVDIAGRARSPWSNPVVVSDRAAPQLTAVVTAAGTTLIWREVPEAVRYVVEYVREGAGHPVYEGAALSFTDRDREFGSYRVRTELRDGTRGWWSDLLLHPPPGTSR